MKRLDMTDICVVYAGNDWRHALPPCSREMMIHLERNEKLVSWLQPVNGTVHDQLPAIRVNNQFYSISLRMMKAIWRHVRLRKGFDNVERAPYGGLKLKIPMTLLAEKLRTQSRFNVSFSPFSSNSVYYFRQFIINHLMVVQCNLLSFGHSVLRMCSKDL